jgi:cell division protein FtsQ
VIGVETPPAASPPVPLPRRRSLLPRRRWVRILIGVGALAVAVAVGWLLLFSSVFGVSRVVVSGGSDAVTAEVRRQAAISPGEPLLRVDAGDVADRIVTRVPNLEQVTVTRDWPRTLRVQVTPRRPLLAVQTPSGWALLDREGVVVTTVTAPPAALPTLPDAGSPAAGATAATVLTALPAKLGPQVAAVSAISPESISVHLRDGRTIVWGSANDNDKKARVLQALLSVKARVYDVSAPDLPTTAG